MDDNRIQREADIYDNHSLKRGAIRKVLRHVKNGPAIDYQKSIVRNILQRYKKGDFLEIGSEKWYEWIYRESIITNSVTCVNISESELEEGRKRNEKVDMSVNFEVGDAHDMPFSENKFDVVFGEAIIHHLDVLTAMEEIHRVLRPGGAILFSEPLGMNPVGMLVRYLTPEARTPDERPLYPSDLRLIESYFDTNYHYLQLFEVPAGVISRYLFEQPNNTITESALKLDTMLFKLPYLGLLSRKVLMSGYKYN
jgi:ubiquinone/menaquinone biosynthesis C-methylase UbiE